MLHRPLRRPPVRRSFATSGFHVAKGLRRFLSSIRKRSLRPNDRSASVPAGAPKASEDDGARLSLTTSAAKHARVAKAASGRKTCQIGVNPRCAPEKFDPG